MSEILTDDEGSPLFYCEQCMDPVAMETEDYQHFVCPECGWQLIMQ
jgi:predicted RNA-binding Zn-ribbon protein involved in translation (DUF1610 family)